MRFLVTALANASQPTGLAVYARMVSDCLTTLARDDIRVVSWQGQRGSSLRLAATRLRWLLVSFDGVTRAAGAEAVLHLLPEVGRTRRPQVVVLHDVVPLVAKTTLAQHLYFRTVVTYAVRSATGVVADSEQTRDDAIQILGARAERVVVVHPGVDLARYRPLPREARGATPFVLAVGSHKPHKRLDLLMRAFCASALRKTHELQIVGPASRGDTQALITLRSRLGLDGVVRFLPYDQPDELARRYAAADIYASASAYEGFGLPGLEALAAGTPVVVTDVGGARAYVGDAGIILRRDADSGEIAEALERARALANDPAIRSRARRQAEGFTWERTAAGLLDATRSFVKVL